MKIPCFESVHKFEKHPRKKYAKKEFEQVCEKHAKLTPKTSQKHDKNRKKTLPKNITKKLHPTCNQKGAKGDQKTTDKGGKGRDPGWNPPRKKKNIAKNRPTAGKGCMREGNTQTVTECQHAPAVGRTRPGGESRLPAAIVPPPGLGKIVCMRKFARNLIPGSMQECFFTNFCLKN